MVITKTLDMPYLDKEIFDLLYNNLGQSLENPPEAGLFNDNLSIKNILIHANCEVNWHLAIVNHNDGFATSIFYGSDTLGYWGMRGIETESEYKRFKATLYYKSKIIGSVETYKTESGIHSSKTPMSTDSNNTLKAHLGSISLHCDRRKLDWFLDNRARFYNISKESKMIEILNEEKLRDIDPVIRSIDKGIAYSAKILYDAMNSDRMIESENVAKYPVIKFDEDERDKSENWNHTLINISYSKDLTDRIKKRIIMQYT